MQRIYHMHPIRAILRGVHNTFMAAQNVNLAVSADWDAVMNVATHSADNNTTETTTDVPPSSIPTATGGNFVVDYNPTNFKTCYFDEYTGERLPDDLIQKAMLDEMS